MEGDKKNPSASLDVQLPLHLFCSRKYLKYFIAENLRIAILERN